MKLTCVIPVLNQFQIAKKAIEFLRLKNKDEYDILIIDNGSDEQFPDGLGVKVVRYDKPIGSYPAFKEALKHTNADVLAFFHSDFFIYETDWHKKVLEQFERNERLGMIGFVGSDEIDSTGGRGLGTRSNFQGKTIVFVDKSKIDVSGRIGYLPTISYSGSAAEVHGKRVNAFSYGAVVDGCSMILRRTALEQIGFREDFPPHHFYDRLIATQLLEVGWKIGILGVECDHISGQTANQEIKWQEFAKEWCEKHNIVPSSLGVNWDHEIYLEAEKYWLNEYREKKRFLPLKVDDSGNIIR